MRSLAYRVGALVLLGGSGCASVLGVDQEYTVEDASTPPAKEAGRDAQKDAKTMKEASSDTATKDAPSAPMLRCPHGGVESCGSGDECCLTSDNTLTCSALDGGSCDTDIPCEVPSDCPSGMVCCVQVGGGSFAGTVCNQGGCPAGDDNGSYQPVCEEGGASCPDGTSCKALDEVDPKAVQGLVSTCQ